MRGASIARLSGEAPLDLALRNGVVAIGNFDGVHRGHQSVLGTAREIAKAEGKPLICLTFEPHPRTVFHPENPVPRLTPAPIRAKLLAALGFDAVVEQAFDKTFAGVEPEDFVNTVLVERLGAAHVVAGFDFHYGRRRAGTPQTLIVAGERHGFGATLVPAMKDGDGETISSSRIRELLADGAVAPAAALLGYRWTIGGSVQEGQRLGRTLGYPTANILLVPDTMLKFGIYAVRLRRADGTLIDGVASFGRRPTFDNGVALFETFLFDFSGDLYGETVAISLFDYLRGEEKFDGAEALIAQMDRDCDNARAVLAGAQPLSALDRTIAF
ncbi:bifunctional riboflavin kinase/FAD synthetase [Jiella sp. MQZ9-1]|uniref:Riboflavin biosynthesis protein n=1 Tax=Jiella flava TaxID=2816857 RepID=A0A939FZ04_9HYPH|nr:bifunctional riboflavin kinase/FAD synthetase [Jiella flava]MBO0662117.1 bifunctional riboflavin kinase/FAD synthetase [Jiella flava]MCD2470554.1 bifunctional riboflavin kinase/FAD synthetase [Jiella flava]